MTGTLIDSSIIIDIAIGDPQWSERSMAALVACRRAGTICINQIVRAEVVVAMEAASDRLTLIEPWFERAPLPWEAADVAGRAHAAYRRRGGQREAVLADFLIGAHASVANLTLLTRDPRRISREFPTVEVVVP